ncbi:MAG: hypothetical protein HOV83_14305, partial [Catenulispora sp.]|nr:hypothetical protein [Catenulispora sp.]
MKVRVASAALCVLLAGCAAGCGQEPPSVPEPAAAPTTAAPSPSARPDVPAAGDQQIHLSWDGKARTAAVHAPPAYRAGLPVVVALHYADGNATLMEQMTGLSAKA